MYRLIESLNITDGLLPDMTFHNRRLNASRRELHGALTDIDLGKIISVPDGCRRGTFKCRVIYELDILMIEFIPYIRRKVSSLKMVAGDDIDYKYKYEERGALDALMKSREGCDDILIIKNGHVTDTSFSNIALLDSSGWVTPSEPLLKGTRRAELLQAGLIREVDITPESITSFKQASLINAMIGLGEMIVEVDRII